MNGKDDHGYPLPLLRPPSRLEKLENAQKQSIDMILGLHALCMAKGLFTHEELDKMVKLVSEARPKLQEFSVAEGIKAIVAAFRIEGGSSGPGGGEK